MPYEERADTDTVRRFEALDADGDGVVTWQDFEHRLLVLARADPGIGPEGLHRVRTGFRALWHSLRTAVDADGDERITIAEYAAYAARQGAVGGAGRGGSGVGGVTGPGGPGNAGDSGGAVGFGDSGDAGVSGGAGDISDSGVSGSAGDFGDSGAGPPVSSRSCVPPDLAALLRAPLPEDTARRGDFAGYHPSGGTEVGDFLASFWDPAGGWRYPCAEGFARADDGSPVAFPSLLLPAEVVDRYGGEHGTYLAPAGTPVAARAIPPEYLRHADAGRPLNYHRYEVCRDFTVLAGPTAPAFAQAGYGIQYKVKPELLTGAPGRPSVSWLVRHGYLRRVSTSAPSDASDSRDAD
ncbi:glycohydrolase toxin TNT-related protein [Streptomyces fractus]|uniref:glycohydrolase toxin TNT-related protein n=1 Tax=Streptomyces fractus TaxID=641806 RepID=UPI003CEF2A73